MHCCNGGARGFGVESLETRIGDVVVRRPMNVSRTYWNIEGCRCRGSWISFGVMVRVICYSWSLYHVMMQHFILISKARERVSDSLPYPARSENFQPFLRCQAYGEANALAQIRVLFFHLSPSLCHTIIASPCPPVRQYNTFQQETWQSVMTLPTKACEALSSVSFLADQDIFFGGTHN